jgi:hypothetical protein
MSRIPTGLRQRIVERAGERCEYCRLAQQGQAATFHIDHVVPMAADGPTALDNLALACVSCSLRKAARRQAEDPQSGGAVRLFSPRQNAWGEHFRWNGAYVEGTTPTDRATARALEMNRPLMIAIREEEAALGRHPPP